MQSVSVFLDIAKFADFRWKNADVSRTQWMYHVIHTSIAQEHTHAYQEPCVSLAFRTLAYFYHIAYSDS